MNDLQPDKPVESSVRKLLDDIGQFARREPATTVVATAFGVGVLINLLPTRAVVGTVTVVGAMLMRPALLSLGLMKAAELCCQKPHHHLPS